MYVNLKPGASGHPAKSATCYINPVPIWLPYFICSTTKTDE